MYRSLIAAATLALVLAPAAEAKLFWEDWFDGDLARAPEPEPWTRGSTLDDVLGKVGLTTITGLTALTVLDYPQMAVVLKPGPDRLTIEQVPKPEYATGHPRQSTVINDTATLTVVMSAYRAWYAGAEDYNPNVERDPSLFFVDNVPRVGVFNPVVMEAVTPTSIVGAGAGDSQVIDLTPKPTRTTSNALTLTFLDVDSQLSVADAEPAYHANATRTTAATSPSIKSLLDGEGLVGATLTGVLTGLTANSAPELGVVNSAAVADTLAGDGWTLEKVVDPTHDAKVYFLPSAKKIQLANPAALDGELVFVPTAELKDVREDQVIALKNGAGDHPTQILALFDSDASTAWCACYGKLKVAPEAGGIIDAYASLLQAERHMDGVAFLMNVDPAHKGPLVPETSGLTSGISRYFYTDSTTKVTPDVLEALTKQSKVTPPAAAELPNVWHHMMYVDMEEKPKVDLEGSLAAFGAKYGGFTALFEKATFAGLETDLSRYTGQLETPNPALVVPTSGPLPVDVFGVAVDEAGRMTALMEAETSRAFIDGLFSQVQMRTITDDARVPVGDARILVDVLMPGAQGFTLQEYEEDTNGFGYASFNLLPNAFYTFNATKNGFLNAVGGGASGNPGETTGHDVRMTPKSGFASLVEKIATPGFLLASLALLGVLVWVGYRLKRKRGRGRAFRAPWAR